MPRIAVAAIAALYGAAWVMWDHWRDPSAGADFDQVWYAATAVRHGLNPYDVIGPHGSWYRMPWPLYYPMPAILIAWPFSFLPLLAARCVFVGISSGLLAYGITRTSWTPLILFLSGAYIEAARVAQWSPLFAASLVLPLVAIVFPAKPTLALICAANTRREFAEFVLAGWVVLLATSSIAALTWFPSWLAAIRHAPHIGPLVATPGGFLLLLAVLRWRRPEAWLLIAYALVPHTRVPYEAVPLMLVARSRPEFMVLALSSMIAYALQALHPWFAVPEMRDRHIALLMIVTVYLPALGIVLRRPNEGRAWLAMPRLARLSDKWRGPILATALLVVLVLLVMNWMRA